MNGSKLTLYYRNEPHMSGCTFSDAAVQMNSKQNDLLHKKRVREKPRKCHSHKPQPFPETKRKRKSTKPNKHKSNKCLKSTKILSSPSEVIAMLKGLKNTRIK